MQHAARIILQLHSNAVGFLDDVPISQNEALRVDNDAGTQRALSQRASSALSSLTARATKETIKKVVERIFVFPAGITTASALRLDRRLSVDVDDAGLQLLRDLGELTGKLLRRGNAESGGVGNLLGFLPFHAVGNYGPNQDSESQSGQNGESVRGTICLQTHP